MTTHTNTLISGPDNTGPLCCPHCGSRNIRKATVYWQCNTCRHEWILNTQWLMMNLEYQEQRRDARR